MNTDDDRITRLFEAYFRHSLQALGNDSKDAMKRVSEEVIHEWAVLVQESMESPMRLYHNSNHVLEVLKYAEREISQSGRAHPYQGDSLSLLAILFHDIIYYSLDKQLSAKQSSLLQNIISEQQDSLILLPFFQHQDPLVSMVATVFGVEEDEALPNTGKNEFLSALVAIRALSAALSKRHLLQIAIAIEATIPFRATDEVTGETPMESLRNRAVNAYRSLGLESDDVSATETFVSHAVCQAVIVGNSDLGPFADPDPTVFIDSNWSLLPEWFPYLFQDGCPLAEFKTAMATVRQRKIDPGLIFLHFRGVPSPGQLMQKQEYAIRNSNFLRKYISIRLLTVTLILKLVELASFGSSSIRLSLLSSAEASVEGLITENFEMEAEGAEPLDGLVFRVLKDGRRRNYPWDAAQSLLSARLFFVLGGSEKTDKILDHLSDSTNVSWFGFLPQQVISTTCNALLRNGILLADDVTRIQKIISEIDE